MAGDDEDLDDNNEPGPEKEPKSATAWLSLITRAEKVFQDYQTRSDNIDKQYADLERLASITRDRQFQIFWANIEVLKPSIYSRAPVPVVAPKFRDRKPLVRVSSELIERCSIVSADRGDIHGLMTLIRDDLVVLARGCAWVRYEASSKENDFTERLCLEHADRKDFLHDPARTWREVAWVAKRSWLTKGAMRKRFKKKSGKEYLDAVYAVEKGETDSEDGRRKAGVWEIWHKTLDKVVWVTEGCEKLLDEGEPHLKLEGFFPCPKPAYATTERRSLVPVPDFLYYKDQIEEISALTARISALTDAVKVRGFYPAGTGELGDAIEAAIKKTDDNQVLIPVANWKNFLQGGGSTKDLIVWLPLEMIATTITQLVNLRKQLIDDVYQVSGLSDIMRGSTVASETLGAQELKSQYGSIRIRDRQAEMVRMARDVIAISAEIMAENFQSKTLLSMSQLEIPTKADIAKTVAPLEQQLKALEATAKQAMASPQIQAQAQENPQAAQQAVQQAQQQAQQITQQIEKQHAVPTVEDVMKFLRDERMRPYVLDIETDSTIAPNEQRTKELANEFMTAVGGFMSQAVPLVQAVPQAGPMAAEMLKFVAGQYRAGRELEGVIDEFAEQMKQFSGQPKAPDPAQVKEQATAAAAAAKQQMDAKTAEADAAERAGKAQVSVIEAQNKAADDDLARRIKEQEAFDAAQSRLEEAQAKRDLIDKQIEQMAQKHAQAMDIGDLQIRELELKVGKAAVEAAAAALVPEEPVEELPAEEVFP